MKESSPAERRANFLRHLDQNREDRGFMADLRCALIPALEQRCWPLFAQFHVLTDPRQCAIYALVAAAYGIQPEAPAESTDFGATVRKLAYGGGESASQSFDAGFRKLLACRDAIELKDQLPRFFKAASQKNVPIDHQRLLDDLASWEYGNRIRLQWAQSYFGNSREPEKE